MTFHQQSHYHAHVYCTYPSPFMQTWTQWGSNSIMLPNNLAFFSFLPDGCDLPSPSATDKVTRGSRTYTTIGKNKTRGKASCQNSVLKRKKCKHDFYLPRLICKVNMFVMEYINMYVFPLCRSFLILLIRKGYNHNDGARTSLKN